MPHRLLPEHLRAPGGPQNTWVGAEEPREHRSNALPLGREWEGIWVTHVFAFSPHTDLTSHREPDFLSLTLKNN